MTQIGTGNLVNNGDGTVTLDDTDLAIDQTRFQLVQAVINDSDPRTLIVTLSKGTSDTSTLRFIFANGTNVDAQFTFDWSDPTSPTNNTFGSSVVVENPDGSFTFTLTNANNSTGNTQGLIRLYPASIAANETGSVIVHGDVEFHNQYIMFNNTFANNIGWNVVNSSGLAGLESSIGQLIEPPMTIFIVAKAHELTSIVQRFTSARSISASAVLVQANANDDFALNTGNGLIAGSADTALHLHTIRYNADASTSYEVDKIGKNTGSSGNEDFDYATLFADENTEQTLKGSIAMYCIVDSQLSNPEVKFYKKQIFAKFNIT